MSITETALKCYHCGEERKDEIIHLDEKVFCCDGCKLVYEILQENNLCSYYQYNVSPGQSPKGKFLEENMRFRWWTGSRNSSILQMGNNYKSIFIFPRCIAAVASGCLAFKQD